MERLCVTWLEDSLRGRLALLGCDPGTRHAEARGRVTGHQRGRRGGAPRTASAQGPGRSWTRPRPRCPSPPGRPRSRELPAGLVRGAQAAGAQGAPGSPGEAWRAPVGGTPAGPRVPERPTRGRGAGAATRPWAGWSLRVPLVRGCPPTRPGGLTSPGGQARLRGPRQCAVCFPVTVQAPRNAASWREVNMSNNQVAQKSKLLTVGEGNAR